MQPHIVVFNPDQFRSDALAHLGNPASHTPVLDNLVATEAVSFSHAFCQNPVCTPSRCSFMTGWYPHVHGHRTMDYMLHAEQGEKSMLRVLKEHGWNVWWGGKNDLVPGQQGFSKDCDIRFHPTEDDYLRWGVSPHPGLHQWQGWRGDRSSDQYYSFLAGKLELGSDGLRWFDTDWAYVHAAVDHIRSYDDDRPMLVYLPLLYPHPPYGVEEPFFSMINRNLVPQPAPELHESPSGSKPGILKQLRERQRLRSWSEDQYRELRAVYLGMCARIDCQVGMIVDALKDTGMWDDTCLLFFSDHGDFTGDYGLVEKNQNTFEDVLVKVPLVIKPPRGFSDGHTFGDYTPGVRDSLVELVDIPATIYDMTGIEPGYWHFGKSLLPVIADPEASHRTEVFCEGGRLKGELSADEHTHLAMYDDPLESLYYPRISIQVEESSPLLHGKAAMVRSANFKYVHRLYEQDEFYDLLSDPTESVNVINNPTYLPQILELKERLLTWYQETSDVVPYEPDDRE